MGDWFNFKAKWEKKCDSSILAKSSIYALSKTNENFSTLAGLLQDYNLDVPLSGEGPFTVFAPNDEAFKTLVDEIPGILGNRDLFEAVLKYHVITGAALESGELSDGSATTLNGANVEV